MPTIRFHVKVLREPNIPLNELIAHMRRSFEAAGVGVPAHTVARISPPNAAAFADLQTDCKSGGSSTEQRSLFGDSQASWSGWVALGGPPGGMQGPPAAVSRNDRVDNVYVRGADNALWQKAWFDNAWHDWQRHDDVGDLASRPAVASMHRDHEHVFVRGTDGAVWQKFWLRSSGWSRWSSLGAPPGGFAGAPATVSRHSTVANVYVRGNDDALWQRAWFDDAWHDWQRHDDGGVLASDPSVDSVHAAHEHVFVRGTDGAVWQKFWLEGRGWSGWFHHGAPPPGMTEGPTTISRNRDVANVYVRGRDDKLWQKAWVGSQWTDWMLHYDDGVLSSEPAPGTRNADYEHVYVRGTDGMLWHKWWFEPQRHDELVVFFVGSVTDADGSILNGCAGFLDGRPGAVMASYGSRGTLAREVGHVFDLDHVSGEEAPACAIPLTEEDVVRMLRSEEPNFTELVKLGPEALPILRRLVEQGDPELATKAAGLAGKIEGPEQVEILRIAVEHDLYTVRMAGARAAVVLDTEESRPLVAKALRDEEAGVRAVAAKAAAGGASGELLAHLRAVLDQEADPAVRCLIEDATRREA